MLRKALCLRLSIPFGTFGSSTANSQLPFLGLEFARLAGKRWRYYLKKDESAISLDALQEKIQAQPKGEFGFMLVAKPTWKAASRSLGIAWCRRTWCNHIILDFLAVHPQTNDPSGGYRGIGSALMLALAKVADAIECPQVWGEATEASSSFYQKLLGGHPVKDYFYFNQEALRSQVKELNQRNQASPPSKP
jgi:N-acetylglutamate synthase-like GNAT family acetyltransferase